MHCEKINKNMSYLPKAPVNLKNLFVTEHTNLWKPVLTVRCLAASSDNHKPAVSIRGHKVMTWRYQILYNLRLNHPTLKYREMVINERMIIHEEFISLSVIYLVLKWFDVV